MTPKINDIAAFWGLVDAAKFLVFVVHEIRAGRIPFLGSIQQAMDTAELVGPMPLIVAPFGILLYASLPASAVLLLRGSKLGAVVSYCQAPLRVLLIVPSIPFSLAVVGLLVPADQKIGSFQALAVFGFILLAFMEIGRVWSLRVWQRSQSALIRAEPAPGVKDALGPS